MFSKSNNIRRGKRTNPFLPISLIGFILMSFAVAGQAQQVHQLLYNNSNWADQNLFGTTADPQTGIASFTTPGGDIHNFYRASNGDVHQLFFNGTSWGDEDLTAGGFGPPAIAGSAFSGFSIQNFQYVYFVSQNQHVHQLLYNNSTWVDTDLTAAIGGHLISPTNQLTAVLTGTAGFHVYYQAANGHIQQLYNVNGTWQLQDLTVISRGPAGNVTQMSAFAVGNFQYVYYVANTRHVHELTYNNTTWVDSDLTALSKSSPVAASAGVTAFAIPGSTKLRVYAITKNFHVLQFGSPNNTAWSTKDLTNLTKGPLANPGNGTVAFATTPNNLPHVYYVAGTHTMELFLATATAPWQNQDLTVLGHGPSATGTGGMAGFSVANFQYVFYLAN